MLEGEPEDVQSVKVEVRIFKAGGSNRNFMNNKLRKCARCLRFSEAKDFINEEGDSLTIDELIPVIIETEGKQAS